MASIQRILVLGALGVLALSCSDNPTSNRAAPKPRTDFTHPANGTGACMGENGVASGFVSGFTDPTTLNCTANDIVIADAVITSYRIGNRGSFTTLTPGTRIQCTAGDTIYAVTDAQLQNNAQQRYDIGIWIATDGGNAQTGTCNHYNLIPGQGGALSLEASPNGDSCGDMAAGAGFVTVPLDTLKVLCDASKDSLSVGACLGWQNSDDTQERGLCPTTPPGGALGFRYGTVPETKSKCNCQPFFLPIDVRGSITIIKHVAGGDGTFSFSQDVGSNSNPTVPNPFIITTASGSGTQHFLAVASGTYHVAESGPPAGFAFDSASCTTGGTVSSQTATITIAHGASVTCNFYNHKQPKIALVKRIVNDNGGTAVVGDFAITTTAGNPGFGSGVAHGDTVVYTGSTLTVSPGAYTLHEGTLTGYTEGTWSCTAGSVTNNTPASGSVTLAAGDSAVCTITNNDVGGKLTLVKRIVNDNGGAKVVGDFGITTTAGALTFGAGVADGTSTLKYTSNTLNVNAGSYSLHENAVTGYAEGTWSCDKGLASGDPQTGSVNVALGDSVTCTITNNDIAGQLTLVKRIVNDNGGTAVVGDFGITTTGGPLTFGAGAADGANTLKYTSGALTVNAGTYSLHEGTLTGYTEGTWSCNKGLVSGDAQAGSVSVGNADTVTCTITNNDQASSLTLVKRIVNDNGGTKVVGDFGLSTNAGSLTFGGGVADGTSTLKYTSNTLPVNAGTYTLVENSVTGYAPGTWSCTGNSGAVVSTFNAGSVTLGIAQTVVCTITNNDLPGVLKLVKNVVNDDGGTAVVGDFGLSTTAGALTFGAPVVVGSTSTYTSSPLTVNANTYTLHEGTLSGYTEGTWSCTKGLVSGNAQTGSVAVGNADTITCTITNNDQPATLKIIKTVKGAGAAFGFNGTGGGVPASFTLNPPTNASDSVTYTVPAGIKSITEIVTNGYMLTDLGCSNQAVGLYDPKVTQTVTDTLRNGVTVTCTFVNEQIPSGTTRTQGFWATHESLTNAVWFGGTVGGNTFAGVTDKTFCSPVTKDLETIGEVLGGFWSSIPKTSTGTSRSPLDQARMQLMQQLLAAILNNAAFGSTPPSMSIAQAKAAYCGTDQTAIQNALQAMASFNTGGDSGVFTPGVSANGKQAKTAANIPFWDLLP